MDDHHTVSCDAARAAARAAAAAYAARFPGYCRHCGGEGWIYFPGTREVQGGAEACSLCLELGRCPGCGTEHEALTEWGTDSFACPACGWANDSHPGEHDGCDCYCYDESP